MYNNDGILIKGNRDGINTTINMSKFSSFEDMITLLIKKAFKGKAVLSRYYIDFKNRFKTP